MRNFCLMTCVFAIATSVLPMVEAVGAVDTELGIEVYVKQTWENTKTAIGHFNVRVINRRHEVEFSIRAEAQYGYYRGNTSAIFEKTIALPPGETTVEVFPAYLNTENISFNFFVNGSRRTDLRTSRSTGLYRYSSSNQYYIYIIGSGRREIADGIDALGGSEFTATTIDINNLPSVWQGYLGLGAILTLEDKALARMSIAQQQALSRWVRYSGGTLWIHGAEAGSVANKLQLPLGSPSKIGKYLHYKSMTGFVMLLETDELEDAIKTCAKIQSRPTSWINTLQSVTVDRNRYYGSDRSAFSSLCNELHTTPRTSYFIISLILGLLIGPVNFLMLKKRKKLAWFYLTAPVLALSGMVFLFLFSILHDGITTRINECALLVHNQESNSGVLLHARGVYAPLAPSELTYSTEDAVLPFSATSDDNNNSSYTTNWDAAQNLTGSWITSRSPSGIFSITPLQVRMGIKVTPLADGNHEIENALTGTITKAWLRQKDSTGRDEFYCLDTPLDPGQKRIVKAKSFLSRIKTRAQMTAGINTGIIAPQYLDWQIIAEVTHLPHMVDGGLSGNVLKKNYYYIALAKGDNTSDNEF